MIAAEFIRCRRRGSGVAAESPAQHGARVPHIGVLVGFAENDPLAEAHIAAFPEGLQQLGLREGSIRIDVRYAAADADRMRKYALNWWERRQR